MNDPGSCHTQGLPPAGEMKFDNIWFAVMIRAMPSGFMRLSDRRSFQGVVRAHARGMCCVKRTAPVHSSSGPQAARS
jgi:hypothetical protein